MYGTFFIWFAIATHRLALLEEKSDVGVKSVIAYKRALKFLGWIIAVYLIVALIGFFTMTLGPGLAEYTSTISGDSSHENNSWLWTVIIIISAVPSVYVLGRLSLIFPATAIDNNHTLMSTWNLTKGNGWPIFVIVGFLPLVIGIIPRLLLRNNASFIESTIVSIVTCVLLAIEITALSLAYKELVETRDKTVNQEPVL